jgi:hypothetical protein
MLLLYTYSSFSDRRVLCGIHCVQSMLCVIVCKKLDPLAELQKVPTIWSATGSMVYSKRRCLLQLRDCYQQQPAGECVCPSQPQLNSHSSSAATQQPGCNAVALQWHAGSLPIACCMMQSLVLTLAKQPLLYQVHLCKQSCIMNNRLHEVCAHVHSCTIPHRRARHRSSVTTVAVLALLTGRTRWATMYRQHIMQQL